MARNDRIGVTFTGDASPLKRAASDAANSLDEFSKKAGGSVGNAAGKLSSGINLMSGAFTGPAAAIAAGGATITATFAAVNASAEKAFETFRSANLSQMGITQIQQMANMYAKVGLSMENVADQQKDIRDKLQDALFNQGGSMYTDVIQPLKLNVLELQKAAAAGEDVYAKIYFAAKAQGMNNQEMDNMYETMGNDAVLRLGVLKQYSSYQEYVNSLSQQQVTVTAEQSAQFQEYRNATNALSNAWEAWNNNALAPVAGRLAEIFNMITRILASSDRVNAIATGGANLKGQQVLDDQKSYDDFVKKNGEAAAAAAVKNGTLIKHSVEEVNKATTLLRDNAAKQEEEKEKTRQAGFSKTQIDAMLKGSASTKDKMKIQLDNWQTTMKQGEDNIRSSLKTAFNGDEGAMNDALSTWRRGMEEKKKSIIDAGTKIEQATTKANETAAAKAKALADKTKRETDRKNEEQKRARAALAKAESDIISNSYLQQLQEFDRQQDAIRQSIEDNAAKLGISPKELLQKQKDFANSERTSKINSMVGINDTNKDLREKMGLANSGELNQDQKGALGGQIQEQAMQGLGYEGWKSDSTLDREKAQIDERQRLQEEAATALITNAQDRENALSAIQAKADSDRLALTQNNVRSTLTLYEGLTGELGTALSNAFGEGSVAAKSAFAIQSGLAIAQTVMNIQVALSNALALPFPLNIPEYLKVGVMGASIISRAKNAASGQAHGGIDEVPGGANSESTWILKGGERVLQPQANKDLSKFLEENEKNGGSTSGDITINSPMIVQGSISDEKQFTQMLNKHQNQILQNVRQAQKRNS
ncbi:hypothetical protein [Klebsiella variicola]|uniref:hypothetical protein n=1 Tax=Klebsiella variicola TaxID=244366 RepID=UPI000A580EBE|nr:hypothetical protein [Klebsiella variicola]